MAAVVIRLTARERDILRAIYADTCRLSALSRRWSEHPEDEQTASPRDRRAVADFVAGLGVRVDLAGWLLDPKCGPRSSSWFAFDALLDRGLVEVVGPGKFAKRVRITAEGIEALHGRGVDADG